MKKQRRDRLESVCSQLMVFSSCAYIILIICHWENKEVIKNWVNFNPHRILGMESDCGVRTQFVQVKK